MYVAMCYVLGLYFSKLPKHYYAYLRYDRRSAHAWESGDLYVHCKHIPHPRQYQQEAYTLHMGKNFEVSQHCTLNYFFPFFKLIVPTRVLALPKKNNDNALSLLFKMGNE